MTYRSFSNPNELLDLLVARFQIPMPIDTEDPEVRRDPNTMKAIKRYKSNYISPIQLRYCACSVTVPSIFLGTFGLFCMSTLTKDGSCLVHENIVLDHPWIRELVLIVVFPIVWQKGGGGS